MVLKTMFWQNSRLKHDLINTTYAQSPLYTDPLPILLLYKNFNGEVSTASVELSPPSSRSEERTKTKEVASTLRHHVVLEEQKLVSYQFCILILFWPPFLNEHSQNFCIVRRYSNFFSNKSDTQQFLINQLNV